VAKKFAKTHKIDHTRFDANWDKYGKKAGPIRNAKMARYGKMTIDSNEECELLAIPETTHGGTQNMIDNCTKLEIPTTTYAAHLKHNAKPC
jgi:hypothetical protein